MTPGNPADDGEPRYSPDGRWLAFVQQRIKGFDADRARLMLLDRSGRHRPRAHRKLGSQRVARELAAGQQRRSWRQSKMRPRCACIGSICPARAPKAITTTPSFSAVAVAAAAPKAGVVALRQSFTEPPTLVRLDLGTGKVTKLSSFNDCEARATSRSARWRASPTRARVATTSRCGWCIRRASIRRRSIPCTCCCTAGRTAR